MESVKAALLGSREVGMAVLASALTTTCVFVPFFFLSDSRSATWMRDAGLAICLAVLVSMAVALSLLPLAASRLFRDGAERYDRYIKLAVVAAVAGIVWHKIGAAGKMGAWGERWLGLFSDSITGINWTTALGLGLIAMAMMAWAWYIRRHGLRSSYAELLGWTLDHRWVALVATVGLTGTGYYVYQQIEHRGTPWQSERRVEMSVTIDRSYSLEKVKEHFTEIERRLM